MPKIDAANIAAHREQSWARLTEAFLRALAEEGYVALSLASVARRAGIARNTIYNYAPTKDALLVAVVKVEAEPFVRGLVEECSTVRDPEERLALVVARAIDAFAPGRPGLSVLNAVGDLLPPETSLAVAALFAPLFELVAGIVEQGIAEGTFAPVREVQHRVETILGVVLVTRRLALSGEPAGALREETTEFLLAGLRGRRRASRGPHRV